MNSFKIWNLRKFSFISSASLWESLLSSQEFLDNFLLFSLKFDKKFQIVIANLGPRHTRHFHTQYSDNLTIFSHQFQRPTKTYISLPFFKILSSPLKFFNTITKILCYFCWQYCECDEKTKKSNMNRKCKCNAVLRISRVFNLRNLEELEGI